MDDQVANVSDILPCMPDFMHVLLYPILASPFGVLVITWGVIFLEILLFMAIIMEDKSKLLLFFFAIFFHLMIIVVHGLFSFFFAMAGGLLLYLWVDNKYAADVEKKLFGKWEALWKAASLRVSNLYSF